MKRYICFKVDGLDNCILSRQDISGLDSEMFKEAELIQGRDACTVNLLLNNKFYEEEAFKKECSKLVFEARKIIKQIICRLMSDDFDIVGYKISEPSVCVMDGKRVNSSSSITMKSIDTGMVMKEYLKEGFELSSKTMNEELESIVDILEVPDKIVRYEFLFEKLKRKCNNSQKQVIKKIENDYPEMYTKNHNIDPKFWGGEQEWQDDFSYLRTLISHGKAEYFQEISERIERDTNRITKILFDLYK